MVSKELIFHSLFNTLKLRNPSYVKVTSSNSGEISTNEIKPAYDSILTPVVRHSKDQLNLKLSNSVLQQNKSYFHIEDI